MPNSLHQYTPSLAVIDPRGLDVRSIAYHRRNVDEVVAARAHRQVFNVHRQLIQQWDPRLLELSQSEVGVKPNQSTVYSLTGQVLQTESVDAGSRIFLHDAAGLLRDSWDGRDTHRRYEYDELMRPVSVFEHKPALCVERFTYAGSEEEDARHNRCGQLIRHDDQAGSVWHEAFGLTGQPLTEARRFSQSLTPPNWPGSEADLEEHTYTTHWRQDPLGAVVEQTDALDHVQRFEFDIAGQPKASWLDGVALLKRTIYNAFGQVEIEQAGNDVITTADYSPMGGQLRSLKAERSDGKTLQHVNYQYDPVGNIERIEDFAQPVQWFAQQRIQAVSTYSYDTLNQLISATGRESASQTIGPSLPELEIFGPIDDSRWRNYSQTYTYDSGGNLTRLKHEAGPGNGYNREMVVDERSNRSLFKGGSPIDFTQAFDANGNQQVLAPGQVMQWDTRNQLHQVTQVKRDEPDGQDDDIESYVYDGGGQRVRKVRRAKTRGGESVSEVRYLPGLEIRTRTTGEQLHVVIAQAGRNDVRLMHWASGQPKSIANDQLRYSLSDHLGSSTLELDQTGELLSQESYYPYGGTAWWAAKSAIEAKCKVIRYSGKERDATGLYYYGFRYYAPWLLRWINPDPAGDIDGLNLFKMVSNNPVLLIDKSGMFDDLPNALIKSYKRDWEPHLGNLAPETQTMAKFSLALVQFLRERTGINVRVGGSLSAAFYGGSRKPMDIDIDVPDNMDAQGEGENSVEIVKGRFLKLSETSLTFENDLFHIKSLKKTSAGIQVKYAHAMTDKVLDAITDDDEIESIFDNTNESNNFEVEVDFSTEKIFEMSHVTVDSEGEKQAYYTPDFLIAAYTNRLALTKIEGSDDKKNDRGQIFDLLHFIVRNKNLQENEIEDFLNGISKKIITNHIKPSNPRRQQINQLLGNIVQDFRKILQ